MRGGRPRTIVPDVDLSTLPDGPGAYLLRDHQGLVVFVGGSTRLSGRVQRVLRQKSFSRAGSVAKVEFVSVSSVSEIVPLVETLIGSYRPLYNLTGTVKTTIRR